LVNPPSSLPCDLVSSFLQPALSLLGRVVLDTVSAGAALRAVRKCRKCGENQSEFGRENGRYQIAEFLGECSLLTKLNNDTTVPSCGSPVRRELRSFMESTDLWTKKIEIENIYEKLIKI